MKRFLIIQTAFIGDVILATPVVEKLKEFYPDARIDFLLRKGNENLLKNHPKLHNLYVLDKGHQKYRNVVKMIRSLRKNRYDHIINLQRFATTGIITLFSKGQEKVGYDKNPLSFCYNKTIHHQIGTGEHEIERNLKTIHHLTDINFAQPRLYPSSDDFEKVKKYQSADYITIAPTSVWYTKQFPSDKWIDFLDQVDSKVHVYLTGGPDDRDACENIRRQTSHTSVYVLAGELTLLQTAALMKDAVMNYVNDSAPLHLASSMDAPVASVFCSTVPDFGFYPVSEESHILETDINLDCRPCGLHGYRACPLEHFKCARTIDTKKLLKVLKDKGY
jgi:heptosyltransferase-2